MEKVIDDFWDTLDLENSNVDYSTLYKFPSNTFTPSFHNTLSVSTLSYDNGYIVMISNRDKPQERDSRLTSIPIEKIPGHITTFRRFNDFKSAINAHYSALDKLERLGY